MAHTEHAKKTHRQSLKARERNRNTRSTVKTALKSARATIGVAESAAAAPAALQLATQRLDKAAKHGVMHANKAARLKSRLAKAMNKIAAPATKAPAKRASKK